MIGTDSAGPRNAWLLLMLVSALSFVAAEWVAERHIAVATIMAIAAAKITVVLQRFMEIERAPTGIRHYLYGWTFGCTGLIFILWWLSAP